MIPPTLQRRIMAHLVAAIHGIAVAFIPVVDAIASQPTRPWIERARFTHRFNAIIRELLALTARIRPAILSPNPTFPNPTFPSAPTQPPNQTLTPTARPRRAKRPALPRRLSARQLAERLATLLRQLQRLAIEAGAAIPDTIHHHIAQARALAGCNALPIPTPSWERTG